MDMPRNYILHAEPGEPIIAVACEVCRTAVFYRSANGAANAVNYHPKVCATGDPQVTILVAEGRRPTRGPGGSQRG
jgi:hypothetical protein